MGMALDEPSDNDEVFPQENYKLIIEKSLLDELGGVSIEFRDNKWMGSGFMIRPKRNHSGSCSC